MNEWAQTKSSFASLVNEADAVVRMFDQEKKHILGLTQALSQIQDSFERLHSRFADVEGRVESFENISGRLTYRLESTFDALQESKNSEAELVKHQLDLRAALEAAERRWAQQADALRQQADAIRALVEENQALRVSLAGTQRDNKLIVAEIANIHSKIALIEQQVDIESLFVKPEPELPRPLPIQRETVQREPVETERTLAVPHDPQRVLQDAPPPPESDDGEIDRQIADMDDSIEFHRNELGRMQVEAENLIARVAAAESPLRRPAKAGVEASRQAEKAESALAASSRAASERKLSELNSLSSSYQALVQELEKSRAALLDRAAEPDDVPEPREIDPVIGLSDLPEPLRTRRAQSVAGGSEYNKINTMRSMFEKRTEDLKAELMQERRERKFAECALRVARAERLHLQHELAKVRAMGWRKITPENAPEAEPAPPREPEAVKRRFTAA